MTSHGVEAVTVTTDSLPETPDAVISRTRDWRLTRKLESEGASVFNPSRVSEICNDKHATYVFAESLGIPTLEHSLDSQNPPGEPPWIVKSRTGHGGSQVFMASDPDELDRLCDVLGDDALIQRIAPTIGRDMRAYAMDGEVLACVMRSNDTDFRANYSLGGDAELCPLPDECGRIVEKVSEALGPCFVGVDFVFGRDGEVYLNEIEDVVGTRMLYMLTGLDPANILADWVYSKISL